MFTTCLILSALMCAFSFSLYMLGFWAPKFTPLREMTRLSGWLLINAGALLIFVLESWVHNKVALSLILLRKHALLPVFHHRAWAMLGGVWILSSCLLGGLYLWQKRLLKQRQIHKHTLSLRIPALDRLDFLLKTTTWLGFLCLGGALVTGVLSQEAPNRDSVQLHWTLIQSLPWVGVCGWYGFISIWRTFFRAHPTQLAKMSMVGCALTLVSLVGAHH